jgi:hypothetical protein
VKVLDSEKQDDEKEEYLSFILRLISIIDQIREKNYIYHHRRQTFSHTQRNLHNKPNLKRVATSLGLPLVLIQITSY